MANDLNQVVLIGRLTRDPELRQIPSGQSVCSFSIANNRTFVSNGEKKEEVSFFNCTAWGRLAEIINQYCQRGKQIAVQGRLKQSSYDNKEGQRVSKVEVVVENMQLLGRSNEAGSGEYGAAPGAQAPWQPEPQGAYNPTPASGGGFPAGAPSPQPSAVPAQPPSQETGYGDDDIPF